MTPIHGTGSTSWLSGLRELEADPAGQQRNDEMVEADALLGAARALDELRARGVWPTPLRPRLTKPQEAGR